jgi:transposase-like protein
VPHPLPGVDYPESWRELLAWFPDDASCLAYLEHTSADSLLPAIERLIEPGSVVATDGHAGYNGVAGAGFTHDRHSLYATGDPAHVAMPRVHRVASLLERWLLGTHRGAVRPQQLDYYLDEFTFRFNRRGSNHRGLLFYRLLEQAVQSEPRPPARILGGSS